MSITGYNMSSDNSSTMSGSNAPTTSGTSTTSSTSSSSLGIISNQLTVTAGNKTWELSLYELNRSPHELIMDETEIAVSQRSLHSELMCPICLELLTSTMTTKECLHRFCQECIITALRSGNKECPTCRKKLVSKRSLRPDPNFDKLIQIIYPDRAEYEAQQERIVAKVNAQNTAQSIEETLRAQLTNRSRRNLLNSEGQLPPGSNASMTSSQEEEDSMDDEDTSDVSMAESSTTTTTTNHPEEIELVIYPLPHVDPEHPVLNQVRYLKTTVSASIDHIAKYLEMRHECETLDSGGGDNSNGSGNGGGGSSSADGSSTSTSSSSSTLARQSSSSSNTTHITSTTLKIKHEKFDDDEEEEEEVEEEDGEKKIRMMMPPQGMMIKQESKHYPFGGIGGGGVGVPSASIPSTGLIGSNTVAAAAATTTTTVGGVGGTSVIKLETPEPVTSGVPLITSGVPMINTGVGGALDNASISAWNSASKKALDILGGGVGGGTIMLPSTSKGVNGSNNQQQHQYPHSYHHHHQYQQQQSSVPDSSTQQHYQHQQLEPLQQQSQPFTTASAAAASTIPTTTTTTISFTVYICTGVGKFNPLVGSMLLCEVIAEYWKQNKPLELFYGYKH